MSREQERLQFWPGIALAVLAAVFAVSITWKTSKVTLAKPYLNRCHHPQYTVRTLSFDPLVQHIENFITEPERSHLEALAESRYKRSLAIASNGSVVLAPERTSSSAYLPKDDPIVQCVLSRAAEYQGYIGLDWMESLQVTRYLTGQKYNAHYDWAEDPSKRGQTTNRDTTFFGVLEANCSHCGTEFPRIAIDWSQEDPRWCRFVDCDATESLIVRAVAGSATFWRNLRADGRGDTRTLHAGLPVVNGSKIGINIWTRREVL